MNGFASPAVDKTMAKSCLRDAEAADNVAPIGALPSHMLHRRLPS